MSFITSGEEHEKFEDFDLFDFVCITLRNSFCTGNCTGGRTQNR